MHRSELRYHNLEGIMTDCQNLTMWEFPWKCLNPVLSRKMYIWYVNIPYKCDWSMLGRVDKSWINPSTERFTGLFFPHNSRMISYRKLLKSSLNARFPNLVSTRLISPFIKVEIYRRYELSEDLWNRSSSLVLDFSNWPFGSNRV